MLQIYLRTRQGGRSSSSFTNNYFFHSVYAIPYEILLKKKGEVPKTALPKIGFWSLSLALEGLLSLDPTSPLLMPKLVSGKEEEKEDHPTFVEKDGIGREVDLGFPLSTQYFPVHCGFFCTSDLPCWCSC